VRCVWLVSCGFSCQVQATTELYSLSLHDALPIYTGRGRRRRAAPARPGRRRAPRAPRRGAPGGPGGPGPRRGRPCGCAASSATRSEEHTSELQSREKLVCRLLLEKKKMKVYIYGS